MLFRKEEIVANLIVDWDRWKPPVHDPVKSTTGKKNIGPYMSIMCCECGIFNPPDRTSCLKCGAKFEVIEIIQGERRGELMALYQVFMVYGEDRDNPLI